MQLIILVILFVILGYMLAGNRTVKKAESSTRKTYQKISNWTGRIFNRQKRGFREWSLGPGSQYFSKEWRQWQAGLTTQEAETFEKDLSDYMNRQGYDLYQLTSGKLKPSTIDIFVEAVTVYSREYRKAKAESKQKVKKEAYEREKPGSSEVSEKSRTEKPTIELPANEKTVAEKQPSRRRSTTPQASAGD